MMYDELAWTVQLIMISRDDTLRSNAIQFNGKEIEMKTATVSATLFVLMFTLLAAGCCDARAGNTLSSVLPGKWNGRVTILRPDGIALVAIFKTRIVTKAGAGMTFDFTVTELRGYSVDHIEYVVRLEPEGRGKGIIASILEDGEGIIDRITLTPAPGRAFTGERTAGGVAEKAAVSILEGGDVKLEFRSARQGKDPYDVIITLSKRESRL